ncbi:hypothetical protein VKT23_010139 [Stygiomarasmius scandens]|uniref:Cytochrome P450 n=1 Tax=Marasmiellus scandens TaxID=2682957 RepID=A0ABR1JCR7_9AGAR
MQWFRWEPERHRAFDTEFYLALMNEVRQKMRDGTAHPSMASYGLEKQEEFGLSDEAAAYTLSAPWAAGVDTTSSAIEIFLMTMLLFPAVMRRAQQELDDVVGHDRLPNFQGMGKLPYIEALIKEVTRWRCVAPLGIPHAAMENDMYNSMFIPRGSTVYGNIFAMTRDESLFTEPDQFRPERFLNTSDPLFVNFTIPFGFGRRQCPGMHVALQTMFIVVTRILWAFNIHPPLDDEGNPVLPDSDSAFTGGAVVMTPTEFKCLFEARSDSTAEMLIQEAEKAEGELGRWA